MEQKVDQQRLLFQHGDSWCEIAKIGKFTRVLRRERKVRVSLMTYSDTNQSYQALKVLGQFFGSDLPELNWRWEVLKETLRHCNEPLHVRSAIWEQDWMLAKYCAEAPPMVGTRGWYQPGETFHSFPTFDLADQLHHFSGRPGVAVKPTKTGLDPEELFSNAAGTVAGPMALDAFYALKSQIRAQRDPAMMQVNQTLAWLHLGLGKLFGGIVLTPDVEWQVLIEALADRWALVLAQKEEPDESINVAKVLQWQLDVFYGAQLQPKGLLMEPGRQGQPRWWQPYWQWMSFHTEPELALGATRMAAKLIVCPPLLLFLKSKFQHAAAEQMMLEDIMALLLLRRLTLQLQVMAWLEHALQHPFEHVRPEDLTSFAYSALRPNWPRRLFALSHRSLDLKGALQTLRAWGNFRYAIDAHFVPHWETNLANVWGLFSAVPGLIRIPSARYEESPWCRREREMFDYLSEQDDFLRGRHTIELDAAQLSVLDEPIPPVSAEEQKLGILVKVGQFPPFTSVFILFPYEAWECQLLACAAVVRMLHLQGLSFERTSAACLALARGDPPPATLMPLTNHPAGWAPFGKLFRDFQQQWGDTETVFPLGIDSERYSADEIKRDLEANESIIDLSDGLVDVVSVLAASEWNRTIVPPVIGSRRYGSFFAVDYRHITPETWVTPENSVILGVNRIRTSVPVWILQKSGQRVDEWPGIGTNAIFTQHVDNQWNWMAEMLDEVNWPATFQADSQLVFSKKLADACEATKSRDASYYAGKWR